MGLKVVTNTSRYLREHPEQRFTAREIARWMMTAFPAECQEKKAKSAAIDSDDALLQQIVAEIGSNRPGMQKKHPQIKTTEQRPRRYYWTDKTDETEVEEAEAGQIDNQALADTPVHSEHALYPLLSRFLADDQAVFSLRIDERKSSNRKGPQGNKWLYPDLVGMEDITADWNNEVRECAGQYGDKKTRLWSFEVKLLLNRSNVREAYFQAVSNSSWANFGYLAAAVIEGPETMRELRMLFALHGIGLIRLNMENPSESDIMIPARERDMVDWTTCSRLADENPDFHKFIKQVRQFYQTGDIRKPDWDGQKTA